MTMHATEPTRENIVEFIAGIFERRGAEEYLGEPVTMA
jgi:predicted HD phosphohydrolase